MSSSVNPQQQYCLKWNNHQSNLLKVFDRLLGSQQFCDVLVAAEGKTLRAHKVVLLACSSYFESIFCEFNEKNQVVILKDTRYDDVKALVEFMYKGEINVPQDQLESLLKTAENLQVKGLADADGEHEFEDNKTTRSSQDPLPSRNSRMEPKGLSESSSVGSRTIDIGGSPVFKSRDSPSGEPKRKRGRPRTLDAPGEVPDPCFSNMKVTPIQSFGFGAHNSQYIPSQSPSSIDSSSRTSDNVPHDISIPSTSNADPSGPNPMPTPGGPLTPQRIAELNIVKMPDYLLSGSRQQFWDEHYVKVIMQAVRNKEIDMKGAAELLGVSYGTLYGRYRETFGYLKHAWNKPNKGQIVRNPSPIHSDISDQENILELLRTGRISLKQAATLLKVDPTLLAYQLTAKLGEESYQGHMEDHEIELESEEEELDEAPHLDEDSFNHEESFVDGEEAMEVKPDILLQSRYIKNEEERLEEQSSPLSLKINVFKSKGKEVKTSS
ncbi:hypothetical protein TCAL_00147 [Tigriopus californicus]|uniref:BTB domain-containing protein n=2 Tax=Tigriopus californicus TaxID=6832 RepID=A0A553PI89_TIGCA|nr:zinc finger and BTB domain-containing protein 24-like isoform X2 [Tigriopus californicus]XP_059084028.1 zinc finger and BTB domain-containing protein 24-like isoform X2 [Tigriopus californicus]TRY77396.1 hypothetical protein TCAL_00147 [Tigriopus californicus]